VYHRSHKDHNSGPYNETKSQRQPGDPQFKARSEALISLAGLADHYDYDVEKAS